MRLTIWVTCFLLMSTIAYGQKQTYGAVKGSVLDSSSNQALEAASISVYEKGDSTVSGYALTNRKGEFTVKDVPRGKEVVLVISFNGLKTIRKTLVIPVSDKELDAGSFKMVKSFTELDEVLVTAEKPPVVLRNDTLEFNAGSFKTPPNSVVEDLLKQLPGAEVDKDGNITFNGKPVAKVMVDGKQFFGSDPKIATRNLPKDIVDKIQITDLKSKEAIFTKTTDGNEDKVINITLKKDKKKGVFGRVNAGYGSMDRYEAGLNANYFNKSRQVSIVGNANNTNRQNYSGGNFDFSSPRSSFGGGGGGLTRSWSSGLNFNNQISKKVGFEGSYFYNSSKQFNQSKSRRQNILPDTSFFYNSDNNNESAYNSHQINLNLNMEIDSMTNLHINSNFNISEGFSTSKNISNSTSLKGNPINSNQNIYTSENNGLNFNGNLFFSRRFKKRGRGISLTLSSNGSNQESATINIGNNAFYRTNGDITIDSLNQLGDMKSENSSFNVSVTYSEPITKSLNLLVRAGYSRSNSNSDRVTTNYNPASGKYEEIDTLFTNSFNSKNENYTPHLTLQYNRKLLHASIGNGIRFLRQENYSTTNDSLIIQRQANITPNANIGYNFSKTGNINLNYSGSTQQPSIQQLQPIPDNRNPLYIRLGNPDLKPSFTHNINGNLNLNNISTQSGWSVNGNFSTTSNQIMSEVYFDTIGRQISRPINTSGNYYSNFSLNYYRSWKRKTWNFRLNVSNSFGYNKTASFINAVKNNAKTYNFGPRISLNYSWKETITIMPSYSIRYNNGRYSVQQNQSPEYSTSNLSLDMFYTWKKRLVIENNIINTYNSRIAPGFRKSITIWNAAVNYMMFKKKQANIRLMVYDLLKQNTSIYRSISQTAIEDVETQVLRRYFMLTFSYNLRKF